MLELRDLTFSYSATGASSPDEVLRHVDLTSTKASWASSSGRPASASRRCSGVLNGLVPHFTGGTLDGRRAGRRREHRTSPPRDLADVVGYVGQDPTRRVRHRHRRGGARLRDGAARRGCRPTMRTPGRGDPRPARHRRAARPCPAHALRRAAAAGRDRRGADRRTRASSCSTSRLPRSTRPRPRTCSPPSPGWSTTSASPSCWPSTGSSGWCSTPTGSCSSTATAGSAVGEPAEMLARVTGRAPGRRARPAGRVAPLPLSVRDARRAPAPSCAAGADAAAASPTGHDAGGPARGERRRGDATAGVPAVQEVDLTARRRARSWR